MDSWKNRWGVGQWAAYFENQALPVMRRSKLLMAQLDSAEGERLSPRDLSDIVLQDPLLCLCLLREAERRKSHRLDHETTTALAAIMQLGVDEFRKLLLSSPEIEDDNSGLLKVEARARASAQIAQVWATGRMDLNPEEVAVAALLAGAGDLLLWVYADEIPLKAEAELSSGRAQRSTRAQMQACGFTFKQLTLQCAERWKLPALVIQLLRGSESIRAQLTRCCSNAARHVLDDSESSILALASDLVEAIKLIPNVSLEWLIEGLVMLPEERRPALLAAANELLGEAPAQDR
jgi:HD-like signal output (HDOD) protein